MVTYLIDASIIFSNNIANNNNGGAIYSDTVTISGPGTNLKFYDNSARSYSIFTFEVDKF